MEDLKGADYQKRLVWKTPEGIIALPYYRSEHLEVLPFNGYLPGEAPYVRGTKVRSNDWDIRQDFLEEDLEKANVLARHAIEKGATAVGLNTSRVSNPDDLGKLLAGIDLSKIAIHLGYAEDYPVLFGYLKAFAGDSVVRGSLNFDPLGHLFLKGQAGGTTATLLDPVAALIGASGRHFTGFGLITINGQRYHNAGASMVQELAFMLSQANEYLAGLTDRGLAIDLVAPLIHFRMAVGSNYFMEIAKIRAFRMLWSNVVAQYHPTKEESKKTAIHAESSMWNKSVYDPYVNLLRTSTEVMSAAIGGADSILLHPFDATYKSPDTFSLRLARNQQIVLKRESYFDKVVDPAAGSYYIENLTDSLAQAAWALFTETEEQGGFVSLVANGRLEADITASRERRDHDLAMRKQVMVGTNQYPNAAERMLDKLQPIAQLSELETLRPTRGARSFEALRLAVEDYESKGFDTPKVFLLTYGNLAMRKARAGFSSNFFGIAGYQVQEGAGYTETTNALQAALESGAHVVVLCSSDEEYAELTGVVADIKKQSPATLVVVAGNPTALVEQLNEAGVDQYIHLRTNALEVLTWVNVQLGIIN